MEGIRDSIYSNNGSGDVCGIVRMVPVAGRLLVLSRKSVSEGRTLVYPGSCRCHYASLHGLAVHFPPYHGCDSAASVSNYTILP